MTAKLESSFVVVRFNERTYEPGGVVAVIKGTEAAERTLNDSDWCQGEENRRAGWRYFLEETDLLPGMDPEEATQLRQVRLDLQESQAQGNSARPPMSVNDSYPHPALTESKALALDRRKSRSAPASSRHRVTAIATQTERVRNVTRPGTELFSPATACQSHPSVPQPTELRRLWR